MTRAERRRARRGGHGTARKGARPAWILGGSALAALLVFGVVESFVGAGTHHPTPRAEADATRVVDHARYEGYPRVADAYRWAAAVPRVLDGLYCYCHCAEHSGHYSLLDCFADDHAARCDVCMSEAAIAYQMTANGASLDEVRDQIDRTYGT